MARFKVGDYVTITRLSNLSPPDKWGHMVGKTVRVTGVHSDLPHDSYTVDYPDFDYWKEDELEPSKEHKVLEILRKWNQTIKKTEG